MKTPYLDKMIHDLLYESQFRPLSGREETILKEFQEIKKSINERSHQMDIEKNQTTVEKFAVALYEQGFLKGDGDGIQYLLDHFKEMEERN